MNPCSETTLVPSRGRLLTALCVAFCLESGPGCSRAAPFVDTPPGDALSADAAPDGALECPNRRAAILISNRGCINDLVISGKDLVWSEAGSRAIYRMPMDGGPPVKLADALAQWLFADHGTIYWIDEAHDAIRAAPVAGGGITTIAGIVGAQRLLVHESVLYWTAGGRVRRKRLPDGPIETIAVQQGFSVSIATSLGRLYWGSVGQNNIKSLPLDASATLLDTPLIVAASQRTPIAVEATDLVVYWLNAVDGRLQSFADDGFGVVDLSAGRSQNPWALALSERAVFWTNMGDDPTWNGFVLRTPRTHRFAPALSGNVEVFAACEPGIGPVRVADGQVFWASMKAGGSISRLPE